MPRWEYKCPNCGTTEEREVPVAERDNQVCSCGTPLIRLFNTQVYFTIPPYMRAIKSEEIERFLYGETREEAERSKQLYEEGKKKGTIVEIREPLTPKETTPEERKQQLRQAWKEVLSQKRW